jgi:glycosyltransferase involved in cell wall biosynthesis
MAFPTYYEPFGLVILEAMSSGLPVIVSRCAGASELIDDNVNGRILEKHDDTRALAQMIMHYTANAETAKSAGQNAKNTAARYCWDEIAGKTYKIYEGIIVDKAYQSGFAPVAPSLTRREHAEIKNV